MESPVDRITIYSKPRCPLCDEALAALQALRARHDFKLEIVDISLDATLRESLRMDIPVVALNGERLFRHRLDVGRLEELLCAAARGRERGA